MCGDACRRDRIKSEGPPDIPASLFENREQIGDGEQDVLEDVEDTESSSREPIDAPERPDGLGLKVANPGAAGCCSGQSATSS